MQEREYFKESKISKSYWWFVAKEEIIVDIIEKFTPIKKDYKILDVGSGHGNMLLPLSKFGLVYALDGSELALKLCETVSPNRLIEANAEHIPVKNETFDIVVALDILEHCNNDFLALKEIFRVCKEGGYCIFSVPSYEFLMSRHDFAAHHRRRYISKELRFKLKTVGFTIIKMSYFNMFLFLPQACFRIMHKIIDFFGDNASSRCSTDFFYHIPWVIDRILLFIFRSEKYMLRILNFPFGLSLMCVARKVHTTQQGA